MSSLNRCKPICNLIGCERVANKRPVLHCWAVGGLHIEGQQAKMSIGLALCDKHAREMTKADDFITDESWQIIGATFVELLGKMQPDRSSVLVSYLPLNLVRLVR